MSQCRDIVQMAFKEREAINEATEEVLRLYDGIFFRSNFPAVPIVENGDGSATTLNGRLFQK